MQKNEATGRRGKFPADKINSGVIAIKKFDNNTNKNYIVTTVREDLEYLTKEWTQNIDDKSIRITSVILRRLLVENLLGQAWRTAGFSKQPMIQAFSMGYMLTNIGTHRITFAQAGGAKVNGAEVRDVLQIEGTFTPTEEDVLYKNANIVEYSLGEFIESTCMVIEGVRITRRQIIKYVTNKLGGVHIDTKRNADANTQKEEEKAFSLLDTVYKARGILGKDAIFYEILSIGQNLINSRDIKMFAEK